MLSNIQNNAAIAVACFVGLALMIGLKSLSIFLFYAETVPIDAETTFIPCLVWLSKEFITVWKLNAKNARRLSPCVISKHMKRTVVKRNAGIRKFASAWTIHNTKLTKLAVRKSVSSSFVLSTPTMTPRKCTSFWLISSQKLLKINLTGHKMELANLNGTEPNAELGFLLKTT